MMEVGSVRAETSGLPQAARRSSRWCRHATPGKAMMLPAERDCRDEGAGCPCGARETRAIKSKVKMREIPCIFRVIGEFWRGDWFAPDCVPSHAVQSLWRDFLVCEKARDSRGLAQHS